MDSIVGPAGTSSIDRDQPAPGDGYQRTLLLVDDEENILRSLRRLLRRDGYKILMASGGQEGLELLSQQAVGVIVSDQRMPHMNGSEFMERVTEEHPNTVRIILSGFTDLETVTNAINRGAIYKFLTKPWDDDLLRKNIEEAFRLFELNRENQRLTSELQALNRNLEARVEEKTRALNFNLQVLRVAQDVLHELPLAVLGLSEGQVVVANRRAEQLLSGEVPLMPGEMADVALPDAVNAIYQDAAASNEPISQEITLKGERFYCSCKRNTSDGAHEGHILTLRQIEP